MKPCLRLLLPAGVLLLVLGATSAACGGDDELPLEEFFQQGEAIDDDFGQRFDRLYDENPAVFNEDSFQAQRAYYREFVVLFAAFLDEMETLSPPAEAEDAFDELLTTGRDLVELLESSADGIEGTESFAEAEQLLVEGQAENQARTERYRDACQSLRELANTYGIGFFFDCGIF